MAAHAPMEIDAVSARAPPAESDGIHGEYCRSASFPSYNAVREFVTPIASVFNKSMAEISPQEQFLAHVHINGCKVRVLIDNGSQITIINSATCERLGLTTKRLTRTQPVHVASGEHYHDSTHSCRAALKFSDAVTFTVTCLVLPVAADVILGNDWL
ncbi:hypothetical protein COEREDRAFT_12572, partial [Coemansia reversa NRRL 1564]